MLRFNRAARLLLAEPATSITDIAATSGYADHSHLVRDFQSLGGCSPSQYRAAELPAGGGVMA